MNPTPEQLAEATRNICHRYVPNRPCPKCGNRHPEDQLIESQNTGTIKELIRRICQRCKHTWYELPLDTPPGNPAEEQT